MAEDPIEFWNPDTQMLEQEHIYGEGFLRFAYEHPAGKFLLWALVKRALFSKWYGSRMDAPKSAKKVVPFIADYGIEMSEYVTPPEGFAHFNDFFYRKLAEGARPIADSSVVFPADGRHWAIPEIGKETALYVKGQTFDLKTLLAGTGYETNWMGGVGLISRLCPVDYHRFHAPVSGVVESVQDIGGPLYSVSPIALRKNIDYLLTNKRRIIVLTTESLGKVAFIPVGATCVGSINTDSKVGDSVTQGDELGYFRFGGSCVITLFERGAGAFTNTFDGAFERNVELYAQMGSSCLN